MEIMENKEILQLPLTIHRVYIIGGKIIRDIGKSERKPQKEEYCIIDSAGDGEGRAQYNLDETSDRW